MLKTVYVAMLLSPSPAVRAASRCEHIALCAFRQCWHCQYSILLLMASAHCDEDTLDRSCCTCAIPGEICVGASGFASGIIDIVQ